MLVSLCAGKMGSIGTHGTGTIEISKEGVGCPSDTARNWYNGVRDKQSKDSPVVWGKREKEERKKKIGASRDETAQLHLKAIL